MNRVLRMTLVAALGMMTINSMAQVERPGQTTVLDATWTEISEPSATSEILSNFVWCYQWIQMERE